MHSVSEPNFVKRNIVLTGVNFCEAKHSFKGVLILRRMNQIFFFFVVKEKGKQKIMFRGKGQGLN
jgi:hypothetical protein